MIKVRDYSLLPVGTEIDDGKIGVCPHCGKRGLENNTNATIFYTHIQEWGFDAQGKPHLKWVWCPQPA